MTPKLRQVSLLLLFSLGSALPAFARPIEFSEISLLVRSQESDSEIMQQVQERRLLHPLSSEQENILKTQGADDSLLRDLRNDHLALSPAEASAYSSTEQHRAQRQSSAAGERTTAASNSNIHFMNVAFGHPVNLSQWGGPDCEIAFRARREAGEDLIEPLLIDNVRTYEDRAIYLGQGRAPDSTTEFDPRDYLSIIAHETTRPASIDTANPVTLKGVPYLLYPVCGGGGVSLYYIGKDSSSVRLAVVTERL